MDLAGMGVSRRAARWWVDAWETRWQLEAQSMRRDRSIELLGLRRMRRLPDVVAYAQRLGVELWDPLAYMALADGPYGRYRLVAILPGHPATIDPDVLCVDGPRESDHRWPPYEDGVFGRSAILCLYYRSDPSERRWHPEHGLLGLFDLGRRHLLSEHEWRRNAGRAWPSEQAPHGVCRPARRDPSIVLAPISPRPTV